MAIFLSYKNYSHFFNPRCYLGASGLLKVTKNICTHKTEKRNQEWKKGKKILTRLGTPKRQKILYKAQRGGGQLELKQTWL